MDSGEHPAISTAGKNPMAVMFFLCNLIQYTVHSSQDFLKGETTSTVVNWRKKVKTDTVKGSSFSNGGSEKKHEKRAKRDGQKYHGTTFTLVQWSKLTREKEPWIVAAQHRWQSGSFSEQRMDKSPKAREYNELGLGEDSFKTCKCKAQMKPRRHTNYLTHSGFLSIVSMSNQLTIISAVTRGIP